MARFNIFRNRFVDAQVSFLLDNLDGARRSETEQYWRETIVNEILENIEKIPKEDGGYCFVVHYCDVVDSVNLAGHKTRWKFSARKK